MNAPANTTGRVYLVGAGPGDPGLITLRGVECLRRADLVLFDYLVNPRILLHVRPAAERICLGQHGHSRIWLQDEINQAMIDHARRGRAVVRLKGGDPAVFGRGVEEVEALVRAGIPFEMVPGITAALAAGSYAGIPVTHRELASAVALVTGQEDAEKPTASLDFTQLAGFPGTLVFYMGVTTASEWTQALIAAGKPADTPAAIVRRCSWPDQRTIRCQLAEIPDRITAAPRIRPPAIFIVGAVAGLDASLSWFEQRPLYGQRVLVTRPWEQIDDLARPLEELGAEVLAQPAIRLEPPADWSAVDAVLARLDQIDWIVFSSANGVHFFLDRLLASGRDVRSVRTARLAAIGSATAEALATFHLRADLVPDEFRAESLARDLAAEARGQRLLLVRASRGREVLAESLRAAGAIVEQVVAYSSVDVDQVDPAIVEQLAGGKIDWVTVTSSAIARSVTRLFGSTLREVKLASISPITSATLRELGLEPAVEATEFTMAGLVRAISAHG